VSAEIHGRHAVERLTDEAVEQVLAGRRVVPADAYRDRPQARAPGQTAKAGEWWASKTASFPLVWRVPVPSYVHMVVVQPPHKAKRGKKKRKIVGFMATGRSNRRSMVQPCAGAGKSRR
jgi:hypothetical protein